MSGKTNKSLVEIHLTQLKPGMFVAELDCGWLATPFAVQGLLIRSQADVDRLFDCPPHSRRQPVDVDPYLIDLRQIEQGALAREHLIRRRLKNGSHDVDLDTFTQTLMQD